jgi:hypothetical protein
VAPTRIASLNAELRVAEEIKAKLEGEGERCRAKGAEYQRFREQCHWVGVFAEQKMRGRGERGNELTVGLAFLSRFGQHKHELIRHFLHRQDFHQARKWMVKDRTGLGSHDRGLNGSPASVHQVLSLLRQMAGKHVEALARFDTMICRLMLDALATLRAVAFTQEGHSRRWPAMSTLIRR